MTIENLEALERAATAGPMRIHVGYVPKADYPHLATLGENNDTVLAMFANVDEANTTAAYRNALGPLLAVAKAAQKSLDQLSYILEVAHNEQQDEVLYPNMLSEIATRREELRAALAKLEATP